MVTRVSGDWSSISFMVLKSTFNRNANGRVSFVGFIKPRIIKYIFFVSSRSVSAAGHRYFGMNSGFFNNVNVMFTLVERRTQNNSALYYVQ